MHGILVNVVEPSEVGLLKRKLRVTKVVPDLPPLLAIQPVQFPRGVGVQVFEDFSEARRIRKSARDNVIVIGEHGPRLELPAVMIRQFHESSLQQVQARFVSEEPLLVQSAGGDEIHGIAIELVNRRVRPRRFGVRRLDAAIRRRLVAVGLFSGFGFAKNARRGWFSRR